MRNWCTKALWVLGVCLLGPGVYAAGDDRLYDRASFVLSDVILTGSTVISDAQVRNLAGHLLDRRVTTEDLNRLRHEINGLYQDAGYVTSGVVIPDQPIDNGVVRFEAVEGVLGEIAVASDGSLKTAYVERRLRDELTGTIRLEDLQAALLLLERDPLIERLDATLVPSEGFGEARLEVAVEEARHLRLGLSVDNYRPESVGGEQAAVVFSHASLTGRGDALAGTLGFSDGDEYGGMSYTLPLPRLRGTLALFVQANDSRVVADAFAAIDIESDTDAWGASFRYGLLQRPNARAGLAVGFEHKHAQTYLLDLPFSLSIGAQDGQSIASIATLTLDFSTESATRAFALRGQYRAGRDWFGATAIAGAPDGSFDVAVLQAQAVQRLGAAGPRPVTMRARLEVQHTDDALQSFEKYAAGGVRTVRGFRENALLRDEAVLASLEASVPLTGPERPLTLTALAFVDAVRAWDNLKLSNAPRAAELASVGVGVSLTTPWGLAAEVLYGRHLNRRDLRHAGVHVSLAYRWVH